MNKIVFHIDQDYGYIALDEAVHCIEVFFPDLVIAERIKNWLDSEHTINTPDDNGDLAGFSPKKYIAAKSAEDFHAVLTRAWENLDVHIDWSFPADCI